MNKILSLALKLLIREGRAGELRILLAALIIAVASLTAINVYIEKVNKGLSSQAAELLGGNLILTSTTLLPKQWQQYAQQLQLKTSIQTLFQTVALAGDRLQLIDVKAVDSNYPLYGTVKIIPAFKQIKIPAENTIWVDANILKLLNVKLNDKVTIGIAKFAITSAIDYEPDAQGNWFTIAPRVLMNRADLAKTKIIQPGSRVTYRLALKGDTSAINQFASWITPQLNANQKLSTAESVRPELNTNIQKINQYLNLAIIICVLLTGIAIAVCSRYYIQRHFNTSALLRCFGLPQHQILYIYLTQLLILSLLASAIGCLLGYLLQFILINLMSTWIKFNLSSIGVKPFAFSMIAGVIILLGFAIPQFLVLKNVSPLQLLRQEILPKSPSSVFSLGIAIVAITILLRWITQDTYLTLLLLCGFAFVIAALYACAYGLIKGVRLLSDHTLMPWRHGLANLARRAQSNTVQLIAFGLVIMVMLLIMLIRNDLINTWRAQLPANAPNYFAINIQPEEVPSVNRLLKQFGINDSVIYPMVRGRLIALNKIPIKQAVPAEASNNNALNRELNLTWTMQLPIDNHIVTGSWWQQTDKGSFLVSMEAKLAQDLGIKLKDELTFQIGEQIVNAKVHSLRTVNWDSLHPNFFMIFPVGILDNLPATYITSFYVAPNRHDLLIKIVQQFPNLTIIDIAALVQQIRNIMDRLIIVVQYLLIFILLGGISVLYAALKSNANERLYESALLRTLGASRKYINTALTIEFVTLGLLAGFLGALGAVVMAAVLAVKIFHLNWQFAGWPFLIGPLTGGILVGGLGLLGTRRVLQIAPLNILRNF